MLRIIFTKVLPSTKRLKHLDITSISTVSQILCRREIGSSFIHTSSRRLDLNEFFEDDNYDEGEIKVGRPWRKEELRIKSNEDLHKLWYVLLKERNLLMTMEHMFTNESETFPSPERLEKVEESMENLLDVVKERDVAYKLLEEGKVDEPKTYVTRNAIGIPYERIETEHYIPKHLNERFQAMHQDKKGWMKKYLSLYEEKYRRQRNYKNRIHQENREEMLDEFELKEDDIPEYPDHTADKLEEYLKNTAELKDVTHDGR